jgi:hypothetical protein
MAGSKALLTRAGIPNVTVKRFGGITEHYWLLVNVGNGWYHFDNCTNRNIPLEDRFLFTDSQARQYTEEYGGGKEYYTYDKNTLPDYVRNGIVE